MSHMAGLLSKWSHQTVYIEHATTAFDIEGNAVLSTSSANTGILVQSNKLVRDRTGIEKISTCQILLSGGSTVGYKDRVTLPDGSQPLILSIEYMPDFDGNNEYVRVFT